MALPVIGLNGARVAFLKISWLTVLDAFVWRNVRLDLISRSCCEGLAGERDHGDHEILEYLHSLKGLRGDREQRICCRCQYDIFRFVQCCARADW